MDLDYSDEAFSLGSPSILEMVKHQVVLMTNEAEYLNQELVKARHSVATLVEMHQAVSEERDQLRVALSASSTTPVALRCRDFSEDLVCAEDFPSTAAFTTSSTP